MPREPRQWEPGGFYHLTSRGSNRGRLFWDDADYHAYVHRLDAGARKFHVEGHGYCLMPNHVHLCVRAPEEGDGISAFMQWLNGGYSRRTSIRYGRDAHLFKNRFHSEPIERDAHLLEVARYLARNAVEAALCASPDEWPWSSHRAVAGVALAGPFLRVEEVLRLFGPTPEIARRAYCAFVHPGHVPVSDTVTRV